MIGIRRPFGSARAWILGLVLLSSASVAWQLQPERRLPAPAASATMDLEALIPLEFHDWRIAPSVPSEQVQPQLKAKVAAAYALTLGRTYVNRQGQRVMLSIAYGSNQLGDQVQAHRPEYCYKAQGFDLYASRNERLATPTGELPLRRLLAARPGRSEPISYWMTMADQALLPGLERKLAQLRHGLAGEIPDGLLIRVSSIDRNPDLAYRVHDQFIRDMLDATTNLDRFGLTPAAVGVRR